MSFLLRAYFSCRHLFPRPARLFVRRRFANRKRQRLASVWPIDPSAARAPADWPGWPDGNSFAFVLTHDVEGGKGLNRVKALAELEMELGFRSAFFFVPEGEYTVPIELIDWLKERGFEVCVHDLHHDGKLFDSYEGFKRAAARINSYLEKWGAVGYRSGFMLRNLDWLHHLNVDYDASTFDTDPFEPQADGVRTIFPYWISNTADLPVLRGGESVTALNQGKRRPGYVELPYSIPQDSTNFLLFKEKNTDVWTHKLDWVAKHEGMALLNVHPDYVQLEGGKPSSTEFAAEHYRQFLGYLKSEYAGRYWNPLPKDLTKWYRSFGEGAACKRASTATR